MFIILGVIWFLFKMSVAREENNNWDLAVTISDRVELLKTDGSLVETISAEFSKLKALTFDNVHHQFLVSQVNGTNDTIYSIQLNKETDILPIVKNLPDDVAGLAVDSVSNILYWTDVFNKTIDFIELNDTAHKVYTFKKFEDGIPRDIAIDSCRGYVYWSKSEWKASTIERSTTDGKNFEILISKNLTMPNSIALDPTAQRIYWTDRDGIYYQIESINFDGSDRQLVYRGDNQRPFRIAIGTTHIYWIDKIDYSLWKKLKSSTAEPVKLKQFNEAPLDLIVKNSEFTNDSDCLRLTKTTNDFDDSASEYYTTTEYQTTTIENDETTNESYQPAINSSSIPCLNGGEYQNKHGCKCTTGFSGLFCEISLCFNYCFHGTCTISSNGVPQCHCLQGVTGKRCEKNICDGYCLNNGICSSENSQQTASCTCNKHFTGRRCEINIDPNQLCKLLCQIRKEDPLKEENESICGCNQENYSILDNVNNSNAYELDISKVNRTLMSDVQNPVLIILAVCLLCLTLIVVGLCTIICKLRHRPRIKKRIIVNKNITPLTYRPQPPNQQCEITIENCCNMNVCETPCFEPPVLRNFHVSIKDEKKTLLSNMENCDDLY